MGTVKAVVVTACEGMAAHPVGDDEDGCGDRLIAGAGDTACEGRLHPVRQAKDGDPVDHYLDDAGNAGLAGEDEAPGEKGRGQGRRVRAKTWRGPW